MGQECPHYPKFHFALQGKRLSTGVSQWTPSWAGLRSLGPFWLPIPQPFPPHPHPLLKFALQTCRTPFCAGPRKQEGRKRTGQRKHEYNQAPDKPSREELLGGKNVAAWTKNVCPRALPRLDISIHLPACPGAASHPSALLWVSSGQADRGKARPPWIMQGCQSLKVHQKFCPPKRCSWNLTQGETAPVPRTIVAASKFLG